MKEINKDEKILIKSNKAILSFNKKFCKKIKKYYLILVTFIIFYLIFIKKNYSNKNIKIETKNKKYDPDFDYFNYQKEMINEKIKNKAGYEVFFNPPYLLNGIIRKLKPKNCLEIGTARGGTSIVILNAIKDIKDSILISLDIANKWYKNQTLNVGYRVKKYFPELTNKWQLYTGKQPHKFLETLNMKFDLLYLDTMHFAPGEYLNIIEALPFLNDNAIVVIHDIMFHHLFKGNFKFHPSNIFLITSLYGDKIIIKDKNSGIENTGAVFLYKNQEQYYLNYFLLLISPWSYMPSKKHLEELELFIKKYYKEEIYTYIFNKAIYYNEKYIKKKF